ncbi:hypothetical protein LB465_07975 [Salegentibacter sp. LM13S]|uniref:hypothetical protein n=1 Tax=Salegentibacter lacus TaxID=2873599 RepID=UPI001CC9682F|nr:hypothetical protein [Salegentibacter lacus]MBZ9630715.1 hypothetical protein [Salegentibacter lacus]
MKYFLSVLLLCFALAVSAQEKQQLTGKIKADSIEAPIHIINLTQEKGSVSDKAGNFNIEVSENDLLLISSVQFQRKEIKITSEILKEETLNIELIPALTELDQVRVHNLSGNLGEDIADIKVIDMPVISVAPPPINYIPPRGTPNAAFDNTQAGRTMKNGLNFKSIGSLITGNKNFGNIGSKKRVSPKASQIDFVKNVRSKFDDYFFSNHLKIETSHIYNFLVYVFEKGINESLIRDQNAFELAIFLENESIAYLKLIGE